jgi:hypothetical protein
MWQHSTLPLLRTIADSVHVQLQQSHVVLKILVCQDENCLHIYFFGIFRKSTDKSWLLLTRHHRFITAKCNTHRYKWRPSLCELLQLKVLLNCWYLGSTARQHSSIDEQLLLLTVMMLSLSLRLPAGIIAHLLLSLKSSFLLSFFLLFLEKIFFIFFLDRL